MNPTIQSMKLKENSPPKKITAKGLLLPKNRISRNGVLYDWESVKKNYEKLPGLPMLYNHQNEGTEKPIGHFTDSYLKEEDDSDGIAGWYYEADINPNSEYADSITRGDISKVSVQIVAGDQREEKREDADGEEMGYTRAFISDVLESSAVPTPGFMETTMEVMAESFKVKKGFKEAFKPGDRVKVPKTGNITLDSLGSGKVIKQVQGTISQPIWYLVKFDNGEEEKISLDNLKKEQMSTGNIPSQTKIPTKEEGFGVLVKIVGRVLTRYAGKVLIPAIMDRIAVEVIDMLKKNNELATESFKEATDRYVCSDCSFSTNDRGKAIDHEEDKDHDVRDEQQVRGKESLSHRLVESIKKISVNDPRWKQASGTIYTQDVPKFLSVKEGDRVIDTDSGEIFIVKESLSHRLDTLLESFKEATEINVNVGNGPTAAPARVKNVQDKVLNVAKKYGARDNDLLRVEGEDIVVLDGRMISDMNGLKRDLKRLPFVVNAESFKEGAMDNEIRALGMTSSKLKAVLALNMSPKVAKNFIKNYKKYMWDVAYDTAEEEMEESFKKEFVTPLPESEADPEELSMGIHVELEHTNDEKEAKVIALQHLAEMPDYYTRLKKMEEEGKSKAESFKEGKWSVGDRVKVKVSDDSDVWNYNGMKGIIQKDNYNDYYQVKLSNGKVQDFEDIELVKESLSHRLDRLVEAGASYTYTDGEDLYYGPVQDFIDIKRVNSASQLRQMLKAKNVDATNKAINYAWDTIKMIKSSNESLSHRLDILVESFKEGFKDKSDAINWVKIQKRKGVSFADIEKKIAGEFKDPDEVDDIMSYAESLSGRLDRLKESLSEEEVERKRLSSHQLVLYQGQRAKGKSHKDAMDSLKESSSDEVVVVNGKKVNLTISGSGNKGSDDKGNEYTKKDGKWMKESFKVESFKEHINRLYKEATPKYKKGQQVEVKLPMGWAKGKITNIDVLGNQTDDISYNIQLLDTKEIEKQVPEIKIR